MYLRYAIALRAIIYAYGILKSGYYIFIKWKYVQHEVQVIYHIPPEAYRYLFADKTARPKSVPILVLNPLWNFAP